jgi:uncharacterized membrane protein YphA (DoxX/SURF4 family)
MTFPTLLAWIARIVVGGLFTFVGVAKIADPLKFAEDIQAYRMAPVEITHATAFILPWIEVLGGVMLVFGPWRGEARFVIFAMTIVFTVAKVVAEARGLRISCGCFGGMLGPLETALSGVNGIVFNLVLCGLLATDFFASKRQPASGEPRISVERGSGREIGPEPAKPGA